MDDNIQGATIGMQEEAVRKAFSKPLGMSSIPKSLDVPKHTQIPTHAKEEMVRLRKAKKKARKKSKVARKSRRRNRK